MTDTQSRISVDEFKQRLEILCLRKSEGGYPTKHRDQQILLKSVAMALDKNKDYAEAEINARLESWLATVGRKLHTDHVTLRRCLVDEGYLTRDPAGKSYRLQANIRADQFEPEIDSIDCADVIDEAIARREQKKQQYLSQKGKSQS